MRQQPVHGNDVMSADENIELTRKFALWKVQVDISRKHVSVRNNVMVGEYKRAPAESASSETRGSGVDKNTLTEVLECGVH
jgi:hypothetical protein